MKRILFSLAVLLLFTLIVNSDEQDEANTVRVRIDVHGKIWMNGNIIEPEKVKDQIAKEIANMKDPILEVTTTEENEFNKIVLDSNIVVINAMAQLKIRRSASVKEEMPIVLESDKYNLNELLDSYLNEKKPEKRNEITEKIAAKATRKKFESKYIDIFAAPFVDEKQNDICFAVRGIFGGTVWFYHKEKDNWKCQVLNITWRSIFSIETKKVLGRKTNQLIVYEEPGDREMGETANMMQVYSWDKKSNQLVEIFEQYESRSVGVIGLDLETKIEFSKEWFSNRVNIKRKGVQILKDRETQKETRYNINEIYYWNGIYSRYILFEATLLKDTSVNYWDVSSKKEVKVNLNKSDKVGVTSRGISDFYSIVLKDGRITDIGSEYLDKK